MTTKVAGVATCPKLRCGGEREVLDTRRNKDAICRRLQCLKCGTRWSTREVSMAAIKDMREREKALSEARGAMRTVLGDVTGG
jgi:transcriptional regulator NrdR family protein